MTADELITARCMTLENVLDKRKQLWNAAKGLMMTSDEGGNNDSRSRPWKQGLQRIADEIAFPIRTSRFPSGTSKRHKIEPRLLSYISLNWCGRFLVSCEAAVKLVAATITRKGLKVQKQANTNPLSRGIKLSDSEFAYIRLARRDFHGGLNYAITPNTMQSKCYHL